MRTTHYKTIVSSLSPIAPGPVWSIFNQSDIFESISKACVMRSVEESYLASCADLSLPLLAISSFFPRSGKNSTSGFSVDTRRGQSNLFLSSSLRSCTIVFAFGNSLQTISAPRRPSDILFLRKKVAVAIICSTACFTFFPLSSTIKSPTLVLETKKSAATSLFTTQPSKRVTSYSSLLGFKITAFALFSLILILETRVDLTQSGFFEAITHPQFQARHQTLRQSSLRQSQDIPHQ